MYFLTKEILARAEEVNLKMCEFLEECIFTDANCPCDEYFNVELLMFWLKLFC